MAFSKIDLPSSWVIAFAFVLGCIWGSFLNVVIYRAPRGMSVVRPGSHCPGCGAAVEPWDNIPIISWVLLRGRTHCCGKSLSPRYVVVELIGGAVSVGIAQHLLRTLPASFTLAHAAATFLSDFALAMALIAAAFIDAEHMYLPDVVTIGGTLFGLATPGLRDLPWHDALFGAAVGYVGVWLPLIVGYKALRGQAGMGLGDAKLVMLAGAWFGWRGAGFALFAGAFQATIGAAIVLLLRGKIEEPEAVRADREELQRAAADGDVEAVKILADDPLGTAPAEGLLSARLPFGPFLCLAIIEWMIARDRIHALLP